ncbi:SRPBCC domain-containing protein [Geodermatophilus sabuli]|uniref:SRPBCC domain-containing protein n=1 Tax=Geodermatophilus sabuli TaxID=1564158 RepID=A0A7K3W4F1_9ACTN|nr:SRPBCC domain-containing protein [Geodermatophilus sabuli]
MRSYESTASISAGADAVWRVLVDVGSWPAWDSGVQAVDGAVAPGATLTIRSRAAPGRAFPVRVTAVEPASRLELTGGLPLGLFRGVRTYTLTPDGAATTFRMREEFTGPLLGLIWRSMPDLQPSFDTFARGLEARVEGR